jgi:hypothetical protein
MYVGFREVLLQEMNWHEDERVMSSKHVNAIWRTEAAAFSKLPAASQLYAKLTTIVVFNVAADINVAPTITPPRPFP